MNDRVKSITEDANGSFVDKGDLLSARRRSRFDSFGDCEVQRGYHLVPDSGVHHSVELHQKLNFQYKGDVFAQRGVYSDATLYMSRLPSSRKSSTVRHKGGANYRSQVKLTPMVLVEQSVNTPKQPKKIARKRQYALAVEAMAAKPLHHESLLSDNAIPSILALCRTKDTVTLTSCITTLCHLSCTSSGREAILAHNALALVSSLLVTIPTLEKLLLDNSLAILANLTIEDSSEGVFVKDKGLDSMLKHRKLDEFAESACTFAIFNLACPTYPYARVDDVIHALTEHGCEARDRETIAQAVYNLSCTKMNQLKIVDSEVMNILRMLTLDYRSKTLRSNALASFWQLAENSACRKAIVHGDCIRLLVQSLEQCESDENVTCTLSILLNLASEMQARELMGSAKALDVLVSLAKRTTSEAIRVVSYELIAVILSTGSNLRAVDRSFFEFLLPFKHQIQASPEISRYVLFSLASILSWSESDMPPYGVLTGLDLRSVSLKGAALNVQTAPLDEILDEVEHLEQLYKHVQFDGFTSDSPDAYLQTVLLYNLSFRYNRYDVAKLSASWLQQLACKTINSDILSLISGTLFSLCQEYDVHLVLLESNITTTLISLARLCDQDAQAMCLEVVCLMFDGRQLSRSHLVDLVTNMFPIVVGICASGSAAVRVLCAACFARFTMIEECRSSMVKKGLIGSLSILSSEEDGQTLRLCVQAYSSLSRDTTICATLIHNGIIKSLTFLATAPEEAVRRACAMTLCNLSTPEENVGALVQYGALRALLVISCVKSNDPETRRICMKAVMNLLRLPANIPQMCQDGLLWAFGLFTSEMDTKDYELISEAFSALAFYPLTREGVVKGSILSALFQVLGSATLHTTKVKLLSGLSNLLSDPSCAQQLIQTGILRHLLRLVDQDQSNNRESDITNVLVAEILMLLFQSCPEAENEFAQPSMAAVVAKLMDVEVDDCGIRCAYLLHQMSLYPTTCGWLVRDPIRVSFPRLFHHANSEAQTLLMRTLYTITCNHALLDQISIKELVPKITSIVRDQHHTTEFASLAAGFLRNLSCESSCHDGLMTAAVIDLAKLLFESEVSSEGFCKDAVALCTCNLFLGQINSHLLLSWAVLPLILHLSCSPTLEAQAISSAVLRKLAIAPGNTQLLVEGDAIKHLAKLLTSSSSTFVKKNCVAALSLLSRKPGVPVTVASFGVISSVLHLVENQNQTTIDAMLETMCVDLLSTLAEFARTDDSHESKISSTLFRLLENDEQDVPRDGTNSWQCDRSFLARSVGSDLSPSNVSSALTLSDNQSRKFVHTLRPMHFVGHAVEFHHTTSLIERRTIEPLLPKLSTLGFPSLHPSTGHDDVPKPPRVFAFAPPPMYEKMRSPFSPIPSSSSPSSSSLSSSPMPNVPGLTDASSNPSIQLSLRPLSTKTLGSTTRTTPRSP